MSHGEWAMCCGHVGRPLHFLMFSINRDRYFFIVRFAHFILGPVMPRRGSYFFLLVQAKVTKKKDTPLTAPCGGSLRCSPCRAAAQLARSATRSLARTSARRYPPAWLRYSAAHRGPRKTKPVVRLRSVNLSSVRKSPSIQIRPIPREMR